MSADIALLLSTFPNINDARAATHTLIEERLVACGNIAPGIESIYLWKGKVETSKEVLVIFKTTPSKAEAAVLRLRALHTYEVPEILCIGTDGGWEDYIDWVSETLGE